MISTRIKFVFDFSAFFLATLVSLWLRLDLSIQTVITHYRDALMWGTVIDSCFALFFIIYYQTYRQIWRYIGFKEIRELIKVVIFEKILFILLTLLLFRGVFPRSVFLLSPIISSGIIFLPRFAFGYLNERHLKILKKDGKRVIIVGAGDAGEKICQEITSHPELGYHIVGFVDDDAKKVNSFLHGYRVMGKIKNLPEIIHKHAIETVIVAIPSAGRSIIRGIFDLVSSLSVETLVMPGIYELIGKKISLSTLRTFHLEDLLSRDPVFFDIQKVAGYFQNTKVLVTGACGSIGSEICRQLAMSNAELILLDNNETGIFDLNHELNTVTKVHPVIADVRFLWHLRNIIDVYCPDLVFHAAAYKHVPLMEENCEEAFLTNVVGTLNCIEAVKEKVKKFVVISTDKAVEPENIMGMSKKMTEMLVLAASKSMIGTKMSVVRFGNVLGSRGNVLEVWKNQLQKNQPLTVTDPAMKRYFMTTQEAVTLVLEASMLEDNGGIYVLKMGELIPILKLAKVFCEIQGYEFEKDIDYEVTGIRPGEKIIEKLWDENEKASETGHPKILKIISENSSPNWDEIVHFVRRIEKQILEGQPMNLKEEMKSFIYP